jgi:hypothetical protein
MGIPVGIRASVTVKDDTRTTSRSIDCRNSLQQPTSGADRNDQSAGECSRTGKLMGLQREYQWVFGASGAIVCFTDIRRGSRQTARGSALQLRGPADGIPVGWIQRECGEKLLPEATPMIGGVFDA